MLHRALMLIPNFRPGPTGGAEIQAERLARFLVNEGHQIHILTNPVKWIDASGNTCQAPDLEVFYGLDSISPNKSKVFNNSTGYIHRPSFTLTHDVYNGAADTFRYLVTNKNNYDLLHCHFAFGHAVVTVIAARLLRKPCIIKIACAGSFGELHNLWKIRGTSKALRILHQADAIIAISTEVEKELLGFGFEKRRIVLIPNGVDVHHFNPGIRTEIKDKIRFILTGRLHPQKGIDVLLEATKILKSMGLQNKFEIQLYGIAYPEHDYQTMAVDLNVDNIVKFNPFQSDMHAVYREADCFLLPSRGEGLSNALLEAMSMGLCVIATNVSGMPDVVISGQNGILIPPDSPEILAEKMREIIENPALRCKLGNNARHRVIDKYSLEQVAKMYSGLYSSLCNPRG